MITLQISTVNVSFLTHNELYCFRDVNNFVILELL
jgi:hypothetical protein